MIGKTMVVHYHYGEGWMPCPAKLSIEDGMDAAIVTLTLPNQAFDHRIVLNESQLNQVIMDCWEILKERRKERGSR